jgi:hypothetical protein
MERLAVFHDGFVEDAAREVADVGLPLLLALRHKSFLGLGDDGRFRPHPLLEAFVRERAAEDAAAWAEARDRHADWSAPTSPAGRWRVRRTRRRGRSR